MNMIGKPFGEGTRRMALLNKLRSPDSVLVDTGDLLEGLSSVFTDQLSLQRSNSLKMAQQMGYFAINIGKEELRGGLPNLLREQDQYQLPFVSASLQQAGEYLFAPYSAFTVLSAEWRAGTVAEPHVIELLAAVDNKEAPEDLPLAPWS